MPEHAKQVQVILDEHPDILRWNRRVLKCGLSPITITKGETILQLQLNDIYLYHINLQLRKV